MSWKQKAGSVETGARGEGETEVHFGQCLPYHGYDKLMHHLSVFNLHKNMTAP